MREIYVVFSNLIFVWDRMSVFRLLYKRKWENAARYTRKNVALLHKLYVLISAVETGY
jgi:hypothetical protein